VSIADAFAGVAVAFSNAGLGPYVDAIARWPGAAVLDDGGSITTPGTPIALPCKAQVDSATQAMRAEVGYVGTDVALLVLCATLAGALDTDAVVEVAAGPNAGTYSVQSANKDPMGTHWLCRARSS
jgi:hypothetical protein